MGWMRAWNKSKLGSPGTTRNTSVNKAWRTYRRLVRSTELGQVNFHCLRHTHATQLLRQGVHPKIVSERLGHASVAITLDIYSHVLPGMQEDAADKVDAALRAALDESA